MSGQSAHFPSQPVWWSVIWRRCSPWIFTLACEAYVGGRWYTFDPTQQSLHGDRVAIAYGRDAADVAVYIQFGDPVELLRMEVRVEQLTQPPA